EPCMCSFMTLALTGASIAAQVARRTSAAGKSLIVSVFSHLSVYRWLVAAECCSIAGGASERHVTGSIAGSRAQRSPGELERLHHVSITFRLRHPAEIKDLVA